MVRCNHVKRCPNHKCPHYPEHEPIKFLNGLDCTQTTSVRCGYLTDLQRVHCEPVECGVCGETIVEESVMAEVAVGKSNDPFRAMPVHAQCAE